MRRAGVTPGGLVHVPLKPSILCNLGVYARVDRALPLAIDAFARVAAQQVVRSLQLEASVA
jgi:hypothetical protein